MIPLIALPDVFDHEAAPARADCRAHLIRLLPQV